MSLSSKIEWTDSTWNPVTGCTKVSNGCLNCYAEKLSIRLKAMGNPNYKNGFLITVHEEALEVPLRWKKPQNIFVNSMSDLFHEEVPTKFIHKVFKTMCRANWHQYQILTKRAERLKELSPELPWQRNVWMGVTVEDDYQLDRVDYLRETGAYIKFISLEPLLSQVSDINLDSIDWVIVGGESGHNSRPMKEEWVINIRNQCQENGVPFFFKQWGGKNKKKAGRILEGRTWSEMPNDEVLLTSSSMRSYV